MSETVAKLSSTLVRAVVDAAGKTSKEMWAPAKVYCKSGCHDKVKLVRVNTKSRTIWGTKLKKHTPQVRDSMAAAVEEVEVSRIVLDNDAVWFKKVKEEWDKAVAANRIKKLAEKIQEKVEEIAPELQPELDVSPATKASALVGDCMRRDDDADYTRWATSTLGDVLLQTDEYGRILYGDVNGTTCVFERVGTDISISKVSLADGGDEWDYAPGVKVGPGHTWPKTININPIQPQPNQQEKEGVMPEKTPIMDSFKGLASEAKHGAKVGAVDEVTMQTIILLEDQVGDSYPELLKSPAGRIVVAGAFTAAMQIAVDQLGEQLPGHEYINGYCRLSAQGLGKDAVKELVKIMAPVLSLFVAQLKAKDAIHGLGLTDKTDELAREVIEQEPEDAVELRTAERVPVRREA